MFWRFCVEQNEHFFNNFPKEDTHRAHGSVIMYKHSDAYRRPLTVVSLSKKCEAG